MAKSVATEELRTYLREIGRRGGSVKSLRKAVAARRNAIRARKILRKLQNAVAS